MATHVIVYKAVATTVNIDMESLTYKQTKDFTRYADSDGTNKFSDDNRYVQSYTVTGTVSVAGLETLKETAQLVNDGTYPKIRVYDKSAADYYNDYTNVRFVSLEAHHITDALWRVTCTFMW